MPSAAAAQPPGPSLDLATDYPASSTSMASSAVQLEPADSLRRSALSNSSRESVRVFATGINVDYRVVYDAWMEGRNPFEGGRVYGTKVGEKEGAW